MLTAHTDKKHKRQVVQSLQALPFLLHGVAVQKTHNPPLHVIIAHPRLSKSPDSPFHTSLIDSCRTVSGFPSSNASCECFSFVLLFEQLSAPASSAANNISGSRQSPWLALLLSLTPPLPLRINQDALRSICMPPVLFWVYSASEFLIGI